jgi:hypothetical protein
MTSETETGKLRYLSAIFAAALLSACAGPGTAPSAEERVAERAMERWRLMIAEDFAAAYEYLSPAQRTVATAMDYQRRFLVTNVRWTDAQLLDVECEAEACAARIRLDITVIKPLPQVPSFDNSQTISEQWISAEGEWWYVPD